MTTVLTTRRAAAAMMIIAAASSAACSPGESGQASPEPTTATSAASSAPTSQPGNGGGPTSLANIDACSLLEPGELSKHGNFSDGTVNNEGPARGCRFENVRESHESGRLISVNIREDAGVDDVNDMGMGIETTEANGRDLAQVPGAGMCMVSIGVTDTSRVDINAIVDEGTDKSCEIADEVAVMVEAKLPRS